MRFPFLAQFRGVTFHREADFRDATFDRDAHFGGATFTKRADFHGARFTKEAYFLNTAFTEGATFNGKMLFVGTSQKLMFHGARVNFRDITVYPRDVLTLRYTDLSRARFLHADLRKVQLTGVEWAKADPWFSRFPRLPQFLRFPRLAVYDDVDPVEPDGTASSFSAREQLYNQLKQNYDDEREHDRAGDFHYGEMEMKRRNPGTRNDTPLLWLFLTGYWAVSGYGEQILRPLLWALGLLVVGAAGYAYGGALVKPIHDGAMCRQQAPTWGEAALYSLRAMTFLRPQDFVLTFLTKWLCTVQSLLGPLLIGLFALAVRRKLKR